MLIEMVNFENFRNVLSIASNALNIVVHDVVANVERKSGHMML